MERLILAQHEQREKSGPVVGMAAVVINGQTGEIWSVEEQVPKALTGRAVGQLSIPLETRKVGESIMGNLEGAMAEAFNDVDSRGNDIREEVLGNLYYFDSLPQATVVVPMNGRTIRCDVSILTHRGNRMPPQPYSYEVINGRWIDPKQMLGGNVRSLAKNVVEYTLDSGLYRRNLNAFTKDHSRAVRVFPDNFSIRSAYSRRELLPDCR